MPLLHQRASLAQHFGSATCMVHHWSSLVITGHHGWLFSARKLHSTSQYYKSWQARRKFPGGFQSDSLLLAAKAPSIYTTWHLGFHAAGCRHTLAIVSSVVQTLFTTYSQLPILGAIFCATGVFLRKTLLVPRLGVFNPRFLLPVDMLLWRSGTY